MCLTTRIAQHPPTTIPDVMSLYLSLICQVFTEHLLCTGGDAVVPKEVGWVLGKRIAGGTGGKKVKRIPQITIKSMRNSWGPEGFMNQIGEEMSTWDRHILLWMKKTDWGWAFEFCVPWGLEWSCSTPPVRASTSGPKHSVLAWREVTTGQLDSAEQPTLPSPLPPL